MKKLVASVRALFSPREINDLRSEDLLAALSDSKTRQLWLMDVYEELKRLNLEVDRRLSVGDTDLKDLAARRSAIQYVLSAILEAKRLARHHNPTPTGQFDLGDVTVGTAPY